MTSTYSDSYQLLLSLLVEARKEAKLTQTLLSARLGKPQSFVSKYERGERRLDVIEFLNVCRQLGADPYKMIHTLENVSPT
ncbi:transcriptional regulator [Pseudomonas thivervalensis]|uniref:Transcriptional regulator n=1 Tax=Pseudomonas thivervalensis TaxID=86265 RepID=A0A2Z4ZJY3_9PSED|nr:helix-turn-helix transcriptional regulator [Pseudomonas thivervalensis]AXA58467.1 transcriptional regulator [Pseudomonas thivervalensis]AXA64184.1 transcriptional regulator [Pseudomonas thivervalensis]